MSEDADSASRPLSRCRLIELPQFTDERGSLSFVEPHEHIPIDLERVYYLYDVPEDKTRGDHAHEELEQVIVAVNGSFEAVLDDGFGEQRYTLDDPSEGLYVGPMIWRSLQNFSEGAVALNLASRPHDEDDYIHNYDEFCNEVGATE